MLLLQERQEQSSQRVISCRSYPKSSFTVTELLMKILPGHKSELFLSCHLKAMTTHQRYCILLSIRHRQWDSHSHMCKLIHQVTAAFISVWAAGKKWEVAAALTHFTCCSSLLEMKRAFLLWEMSSKPEKPRNEAVSKHTEDSVTNIWDLFMYSSTNPGTVTHLTFIL